MSKPVCLYRPTTASMVVLLTVLGYGAVFAVYHQVLGVAVASLAIIPVMAASWYFGSRGGLLTALAAILFNILVLQREGHTVYGLYREPGNVIGTFSLLLVAVAFGKFGTLIHERKEAIARLEEYERERDLHTKFLESLNQITAGALESDGLQATLENLAKNLARLFSADDVFFALWDASQNIPVPTLAFGSMKEVYPYIQFEPGEVTLSTSVMKAGHPLAVLDIDNSEYLDSKVAAIFPSRSMLGIPLLTQGRKLGSILLGYNQPRTFDERTMSHAGVVSEQVALVLSKLLLLEEEHKQVHQLTALHDVAMVSIEADDQDQLIEKVTNIIGQSLFPDNFGILLMDQERDVLCAHPSYRFRSSEKKAISEVELGQGISGEVARTGRPMRLGNVRHVLNYLDMDDTTMSELCVPIKFKEQVLGVINAESTKQDAFTADDERLLTTLAGQIATALEQLRKAQAERKWLDQLAHSNDLIYAIAQITTQIEQSLTRDEIIQTLGNQLEHLGLTCILAVYEKDHNSFTINFTTLPPALLRIVEEGLGYPLLNYSFARHKLDALVEAGDLLRPTVVHDPGQEIKTLFTRINPEGVTVRLQRIGVTPGIEPIRLPLVFEGELLGILWVWGRGITRSDLPILSIFAKQVGISLERARLFQEVQSLALTDPLTGLQNRRSIFELGRIEFARAQRLGRPFCCMMLDLDHFKQVNDNYGHQTGDEVLREFAKRCQSSVREVDLVGRYGGEELIILLPETDRDTAVQVAERVRLAIAGTRFLTPRGGTSLTVSIGVATKDDNTTHLEALIARADQALYIAKHKGRNRVAISR